MILRKVTAKQVMACNKQVC